MERTTPVYEYSDYTDYTGYTGTPPGICDYGDENYFGAQLSVIYYFMFVFSVCGNGLVLVIIHRFEKLTTVTNILLLNLVLSSLIFMSSLPFMGVYMQLSNWIFGRVMCKIVFGVYYLGFYSSVLFLTLLTFDRHLAVVYSLGASRVRSRRYAVISCAVIWLVSALACIRPWIMHNTIIDHFENKTLCGDYIDDPHNGGALRTSGFYLQLLLFLIFPLLVVIYCYSRIAITVISSKIATKFKTVRLIFVIVLLFFLCWTPFNVVLLMQENNPPCEEQKRRIYALHVTRNIAYIYFCVSPIFYTFVGKKFQNYFLQMMVKRFPSLKRHISISQVSRTNLSTKSTQNGL